MKKYYTRWLSAVMAVLLILSLFPGAVLSEGLPSAPQQPALILDENEAVALELNEKAGLGIVEIESLREETVKHFQLPDGTYRAIDYGQAVHVQDADGRWTDIDNRLSLSDGVYGTEDGRLTFAADSDAETLYTVTDGVHTVSVSVDGLLPAAAEVENHPEPKPLDAYGTDEEKLASLTVVDNTTRVLYRGIGKNVDLEYVLSSVDVKENIILASMPETPEFAFRLRLDGLVAEQIGDAVVLFDAESGEEDFTIPAPYMFDAKGAESYAVSYRLEDEGDGSYRLIVTADAEWLAADTTVYPVTVDPSLTKNTLSDTFIDSTTPTTNYGSNTLMTVSTDCIAYMRATLGALPTYAEINSATVNFYYSQGYPNMIRIGVCQCLQGWLESTLTWNSASAYTDMGLGAVSSPKIFATVDAPLTAWETMDVTEIVKRWYVGEATRGVALKRISGTGNITIYSRETSYCPFWTINYTIITPIVENGTYFIQNAKVRNFLQLDNDDGPSYWTEDAPIELFDFDAQIYQKWNIAYLHNGYYRILSAKSNKSLSIKVGEENTANATVCQEVNLGTVRQQWSITSAHTGQFKIKPRSSEGYSSDWCLAENDGSVLNGRLAQQRTYSNNNDFIDEWYINSLTVDYSNVFIGYYVGDTYMPPIISEVQTEFWNNGFIGNSYIAMTKAGFEHILKNTSVLACLTHGDENSIVINTGVDYTISDLNSLTSTDLAGLNFVCYSCCESGKDGSSGNNIVNATSAKGVDFVLGFKIRILTYEANAWTKALMKSIADGNTVGDAIAYADIEMVNDAAVINYHIENPLAPVTITAGTRYYCGSLNYVPCP